MVGSVSRIGEELVEARHDFWTLVANILPQEILLVLLSLCMVIQYSGSPVLLGTSAEINQKKKKNLLEHNLYSNIARYVKEPKPQKIGLNK